MVRVKLEISNGGILHGLRDASSTVGIATLCCGSVVA